jgi:Domain of unknown function (DUF6429)
MEYDTTKLDEVVLALRHLNAHTHDGITRAWKGFDWDSLDRLHAQGFISESWKGITTSPQPFRAS